MATKQRTTLKEKGKFHHGDLRRALIEAASRLLEEEGPLGVSLRAAARLAGVSQTAPYRHFADKEALLAAVAEEGLDALRQRMAEARQAASGSGMVLRAVGKAYLMTAAEKPHLFRLMFGPEVADKARHPGVRAAGERVFQLVVDTVAAGQRAGLVRAGEPRDLALAQWAAVHGFASLIVDGRLADQVEAAGGLPAQGERLAEQLRLGIAPR